MLWQRKLKRTAANAARQLVANLKPLRIPPGTAQRLFFHRKGVEDAKEGQMEKPIQAAPPHQTDVEQFAGGGEGGPGNIAKGASTIVLYNDRLRVTADVDIDGAKDLVRKLQKRIELLEDERGPN